MKLTFPWPDVLKALEEIKSAKTARTLYGRTLGPCLLLVGDHGVYLTPNTTDGMHHATGAQVIVYAHECDPRTMAFDDWWDAKNRSFGGDDGCELITITDLLILSDTEIPATTMITNLAISFSGDAFDISIELAHKH